MRLENGQTFPDLTASLVAGGEITLPNDLRGRWSVVLFYRGGWCPYCQAQLRAFERHRDQFDDLDVQVLALSVDDEEDAAATVEDKDLGFPVAYGLDRESVGDTIGAYSNAERGYLESTGFILDDQGAVQSAVYSSNAIGRYVPADVLGFVKYHRSED